jgi:protein-S-isoprenylcysteine O-methyltransferase Ste14
VTTFDEVRLAVFIAVSIALVVVSRRVLFNFRSHGFFRFFAWEAIVAVITWNSPFWFSDPFSGRQLLSWVLLFVSLVVLWQGVSLLRAARPTANRTDSELYGFEKTSELVTSGIYRHIRHPLYASLLYLAWGAFLKDISWISAALMVVASTALVATARADERECVQYFGPRYEEYMRRTKMFIPFVF